MPSSLRRTIDWLKSERARDAATADRRSYWPELNQPCYPNATLDQIRNWADAAERQQTALASVVALSDAELQAEVERLGSSEHTERIAQFSDEELLLERMRLGLVTNLIRANRGEAPDLDRVT